MARQINLLRIAGFQISIDYSWFIIFGLVTWSLATSYFPHQYPHLSPSTYWTMSALAAVLLFVSVLLHELGHSFVARRHGLDIRGITLFIFGGVAQITREPPSGQVELKVALAGPAVSLLLAILFGSTSMLLQGMVSVPVVAILKYLALLNITLLAFNLIPGFPLDGGRVLRAHLWQKMRSLKRATAVASRVGKGFAFVLIVIGVASIVLGNFGGLWYIFIGMFLHQAASASYQQVAYREALMGVQVKDLMSREVISVSSSLPVDQLVEEYFFRHRFDCFPVVEEERLVGLVTLDHVKHIPREAWPRTLTREAMEEVPGDGVLDPEDDAVEGLRKMLSQHRGRLPVVSAGKLVGMLTRRDILDLLRLKTDLGE